MDVVGLDRYQPNLCVHIHLYENGIYLCVLVRTIYPLGGGCRRSDGRLCCFVAAGSGPGSALHGVYVQRDEFDICPIVVGTAVS